MANHTHTWWNNITPLTSYITPMFNLYTSSYVFANTTQVSCS